MREVDLAALNATLSAFADRVPDSVEYQRLGGIVLQHPLVPVLARMNPFSDAYKAKALELYRDLRGDDRPYEPERDEQSGILLPDNLWTGASPWNFRDAKFVSEFLLSWGQIMRALAVSPGSDATILEYGSGSGQLLLFLARLGLRTSAVDIDRASLELLQAQASAMQLDVRTEQAAFGQGFGEETFDRIVFFEAFHHALDFGPLLCLLRRRLNPGGLLILCGEPVVGSPVPGVPYPWGPRLDGLSIFCIRRYGWMELGFTEPFLIEALHRHGWLVEIFRMPECGRATTYVARPYVGTITNVGRHLNLGSHDVGWEGLEQAHRWTRGGAIATFPLPDQDGPSRVKIRVCNPFPLDRKVILYDGARPVKNALVAAGSDDAEIVVDPCLGSYVGIKCAALTPAKVWPNSQDKRQLGLMVYSIHVEPTTTPQAPPEPDTLSEEDPSHTSPFLRAAPDTQRSNDLSPSDEPYLPDRTNAVVMELRQRVAAMEASTSWKVTKPLRRLRSLLGHLV